MSKWVLFVDGIKEGIYTEENKEEGYMKYLEIRMAKIQARWIQL